MSLTIEADEDLVPFVLCAFNEEPAQAESACVDNTTYIRVKEADGSSADLVRPAELLALDCQAEEFSLIPADLCAVKREIFDAAGCSTEVKVEYVDLVDSSDGNGSPVSGSSLVQLDDITAEQTQRSVVMKVKAPVTNRVISGRLQQRKGREKSKAQSGMKQRGNKTKVAPSPPDTVVSIAHRKSSQQAKVFHCSVCPTSFTRSCHLYRHMRSHVAIKRHVCKTCASAFAQRGDLLDHLRTHTGEKPFRCELCPAAYKQSGHLAVHRRSHTGETPYACDTCSKSFKRGDDLQSHMRTHTGDKPYVCDACRKAFSRKSALKRHARTHTGEKPFSCNVCRRAFHRSDLLALHVAQHTSKVKFRCQICAIPFATVIAYNMHMKSHT